MDAKTERMCRILTEKLLKGVNAEELKARRPQRAESEREGRAIGR